MIKPNPEQESIINYFIQNPKNRILLVEAPPGTGKTFTAVATAMKFTNFNIESNPRYNKKVLILTFSKNARAQIEKQLDALSSNDVNCDKYIEINWDKYIEIINFHSFFQKYVWAYSKYLGLKDNLIILSPKKRKEILTEKFLTISGYDKNDDDLYNWAEALLEGDFRPKTRYGKVKSSVEKLIPYMEDIKDLIKDINKEGYIGFSDIAYYMLELINKSPALLNIIQNKYGLIILDEYQDSSDLQDEIVKKLIGKNNKAIFFADSKQMIYGWRGASAERLKNLLVYYNGEIEQKELTEIIRFKNREDIKALISQVRKGNFSIENFKSSENIKYVKVDVNIENSNVSYKEERQRMLGYLKFELIRHLPKNIERKNKSVGILCRNNKLVNFINKSLIKDFNTYSKIISTNEDEHNLIYDLIEFMKKEQIEKDELCREIFKYVFAIIYDNNIGSIKRDNKETVSFDSLKNVRVEILRKIKEYIELAYKDKDYYKCLYNVIKLVSNSKLKINIDILKLLKKVLCLNCYSEDKVMNIFLQYQYLQAFKNLKGIYVLNVHQSKGREFNYVYILDIKSIINDENLLYVALSRVKEKLVVFDWV